MTVASPRLPRFPLVCVRLRCLYRIVQGAVKGWLSDFLTTFRPWKASLPVLYLDNKTQVENFGKWLRTTTIAHRLRTETVATFGDQIPVLMVFVPQFATSNLELVNWAPTSNESLTKLTGDFHFPPPANKWLTLRRSRKTTVLSQPPCSAGEVWQNRVSLPLRWYSCSPLRNRNIHCQKQ